MSALSSPHYQMPSLDVFIGLINHPTQMSLIENESASIAKDTALEIIGHIFSMAGANASNSACKSLAEGIFEDKAQIPRGDFVRALRLHIGYINRYIKEYYATKFLERRQTIKMPLLQDESDIITDGDVPLFFLGEA